MFIVENKLDSQISSQHTN